MYLIDTIHSLQPVQLPPEVHEDRKKMTKFLQQLTKTVNKLIRGS